jgi:hypothetical protein
MKDQISLTLAAVTALGVAMGVMTARAAADKDIVDTAIAAGQFNTLGKSPQRRRTGPDVEGAGTVHRLCSDR